MISHQHEFDKIISQCHPYDYLFIICHNTRTNRNLKINTYPSHIYYTSTHCHFLTLQITVCLSCQTQQAMHNALCDVLWTNKNKKIFIFFKFKKKNSKKKFKKKLKKKCIFFFKNKIFPNKNFNIFPPIKFASYHTHRITLVVSHSHATSGGI